MSFQNVSNKHPDQTNINKIPKFLISPYQLLPNSPKLTSLEFYDYNQFFQFLTHV